MQGCTCGYEGNCLSAECEALRRWPKDPRARVGAILKWQDATARALCMNMQPPSPQIRASITKFYNECETAEDYLDAYSMMHDVGMLYHTKEGWHDRNGRTIKTAR